VELTQGLEETEEHDFETEDYASYQRLPINNAHGAKSCTWSAYMSMPSDSNLSLMIFSAFFVVYFVAIGHDNRHWRCCHFPPW
jgi:hypothetical protein